MSAYCTNGVYDVRLGGNPHQQDWDNLLMTLLRLQTVGLVTGLASSSEYRGYNFQIVNGAEGRPGLAWLRTALVETAARQA
jgi:hypothetical protein